MNRSVFVVCAVVLIVAGAATAWAWHDLASMPAFPHGGGHSVVQHATPRTVYRSVAGRAGGDQRRPGVRYGCMEVDAGRVYRCVVPGSDAGDRRYRVTVDGRSCWTALRAGERPAHGCLRSSAGPD